jgi:puromycin-sensitive aminopeptidase
MHRHPGGLLNGREKLFIWTSLLSLALLAIGSQGSSAHPVMLSSSPSSLQLPCDAEPESYKIFVEPNLDDGKFSGSESIKIKLLKATEQFVMNSADIKISEAECSIAGEKNSVKLGVHFEPKSEKVVFTFPRKIEAGEYTVDLKFQAGLNEKSRGLYRSSYEDNDGHKHWFAATQMEPTDARGMFPCFDEPRYKATFTISAAINSSDVAISNAPVAFEKTLDKTHKLVQFETSPKMSTYLVALVVGPFQSSEVSTSEGVPIRVWYRPGKAQLAKFSQDIANKAMSYYRNYFAIPYPAKKLDLIAIPDFSFGAMENLGAATFAEENLLVDDQKGSLNAKQQVAINVAHEMAHMWFGDLVTMKWWDDLWLNEAFAEWLSTKTIDKLHPDWLYWNQFALERDQSMLSDSLKATRAIHFDVQEQNQIAQMFDEITYEKGASVLRMLETHVGEDQFRDGIRRYLKGHEFDNATSEDLWSAITAQSGKDVSELMHGWVYQDGFPIVDVKRAGNRVTLSQRRFSFERLNNQAERSWQIPLRIRRADRANSAVRAVVMSEKEKNIGLRKDFPVIVNAGGEGYFHARYSPELLNEISDNLDMLTPLERAAVLADQFYLAVSGQMPVRRYFEFSKAYRNETDPSVVAIMCSEMNQLNLMIGDRDRPAFAEFVRDRLQGAKNSLHWTARNGDSESVRRERGNVLLTLGTIGEEKDVINHARADFKDYFTAMTATGAVAKRAKASIDHELVEPLTKIVAYNGDEKDYERVLTLWHQAKSPEDVERNLMALTLFQEPELQERTLKLSLSNQIRRQDGPQLIAKMMETRSGRGPAWHFFHKHIIRIAWRFSDHLLFYVVMAMNNLGTDQQLEEVQSFFKKHPVPSQSRGINKVIEAIEVRVAFRQRNESQLSASVSDYSE